MCGNIYNKIPFEIKLFNFRLFKTNLYKWFNVDNFYDNYYLT